MCRECGWLSIVADIRVNLETRDMAQHTSRILEAAADIIEGNEHIEPDQADAIEALREREGWPEAAS